MYTKAIVMWIYWKNLNYKSILLFVSILFSGACEAEIDSLAKDVLMEGSVVAKGSGMPIPGIEVTVDGLYQTSLTDENGRFSIYVEQLVRYRINFKDIDGALNGTYVNQQKVAETSSKRIQLKVEMQAKN